MAAHNLGTSLNAIFHHEAGFVNHPRDPGGATNHGVTRATLSAYLRREATVQDVRQLTKETAHKILKSGYADPIQYDKLPSGIDHAVLDFAVNSGPNRAVKELQKTLNKMGYSLSVDGIMGLKTLDAISKTNPKELIGLYCDQRIAFVKSLKTFGTFGRGWMRRITGVDPKGEYKKQLGIIGESLAMLDGKVPQGIDKAATVETAKARDTDRKATATVGGKASVGTLAAIAASIAAATAEALAPYGDTFKWIGYVSFAAVVVGAVATAVITINNARDEGLAA